MKIILLKRCSIFILLLLHEGHFSFVFMDLLVQHSHLSASAIHYTASSLRHLHFPTLCAVCANADEKEACVEEEANESLNVWDC